MSETPTRGIVVLGVLWCAVVVVAFSGRRSIVVKGAGSWSPIAGDRVTLRQGSRYRACIVLPWYVPTSLVLDRLRPELEKRGFVDVVVTRGAPAGWPVDSCDFGVECTWSRSDEVMVRPSQVSAAWVRV